MQIDQYQERHVVQDDTSWTIASVDSWWADELSLHWQWKIEPITLNTRDPCAYGQQDEGTPLGDVCELCISGASSRHIREGAPVLAIYAVTATAFSHQIQAHLR